MRRSIGPPTVQARCARRTADELAAVDAGCRFLSSGAYPFRGQGIGIPTLREVLAGIRDIPIIIEMKVDAAEMGQAVAAEVRRADAVDRVCVAGFGCRAVRAARATLPDMASSACATEVRLALYRSWVRWPVQERPIMVAIRCRKSQAVTASCRRRFVRLAHTSGLKVQVWTVDDEPT